MSGPVPATGPCPHGVVEGLCYRCTMDTELLRIAAQCLRGDLNLPVKDYRIIGNELERIAGELEDLETALSDRAKDAAEQLAGSALGVYEPPADEESYERIHREVLERQGDKWSGAAPVLRNQRGERIRGDEEVPCAAPELEDGGV